jgi:TolB-like protein
MKKIKNILKLTILWSIFVSFIFADDNNNLSFVNIPLGNSISLGNEMAVVDNGVFNLFSNPAMLGKIQSVNSIEYNRLFYYGDTYYDLLGLCGTNISQGIVSGIVLGKFSSGNILVKDIEGLPTGESLEYTITTVNIGLSTRWGKYLWLGFSGYGLWEKSNIDSRFFGSNVGLIYNFNIKNKFLKYFRFGTTVRGLGLNKNLVHNEAMMIKLLNAELYFGRESNTESGIVNNNNEKLNAGISLSLVNSNIASLNFRLGISGFNNELVKSYGGGFGLRYKDFGLDYSINIHNYLNMIHNIKIGYFFGEPSSVDYMVAVQKKEQKIVKMEKERKIKVAVANFIGKNVSDTDATIVSDLFRSQLVKTKKYDVLDRTNMEIILNEQKFQSLGITETNTAVEVGKLLNVEQIIFGVVAKIKDMYYLTINFVDVKSGRIVNSESAAARDLQEFPKVCKEIVKNLIKE